VRGQKPQPTSGPTLLRFTPRANSLLAGRQEGATLDSNDSGSDFRRLLSPRSSAARVVKRARSAWRVLGPHRGHSSAQSPWFVEIKPGRASVSSRPRSRDHRWRAELRRQSLSMPCWAGRAASQQGKHQCSAGGLAVAKQWHGLEPVAVQQLGGGEVGLPTALGVCFVPEVKTTGPGVCRQAIPFSFLCAG